MGPDSDYRCGGKKGFKSCYGSSSTYSEAEINKPRGRGAALSPTTFEVSLYRDGESVANHQVDARLSVNAADWPEVALVLDEPMAEVRWYPKTRTLVGARDVDGPASAGDPIE